MLLYTSAKFWGLTCQWRGAWASAFTNVGRKNPSAKKAQKNPLSTLKVEVIKKSMFRVRQKVMMVTMGDDPKTM